MLRRFLNMENLTFHALVLLITLVIVSESSVIVPRSATEESSPDVAEFEKDKTLNWDPAKWDHSGLLPEDFPPSDFEDDGDSNDIDEKNVDKNFPEHDKIPEHGGEIEKDIAVVEKPASEGFPGPFDSDEDFEKSLGGDKDSKFPDIEDKEFDKPVVVDSEPPLLDGDDKSEPDEVDESHKEEEGALDEDEEGKEEPGPIDESDEDIGEKGVMPGYFGAGSIFDTPFFNLEQVQKYFHQLESALQHVFRQTVDEAMLLNGTYANTTEEEVDINGKKYIVHKSVIKGGDNDSSIYVETLSSKPKMDVVHETNSTKEERR